MTRNKKKLALWTASLCAVALIMGMVACSPQQSGSNQDTQSQQQQVKTPEADEFGVILASSWAEVYPNQYATYLDNEANSRENKHVYPEYYPEMKTLFAGWGFSKGYDEPASHLYSLESINATPRVGAKTTAACITCKTPQFTATVNSEGVETYSKPFSELIGDYSEPISCYNCHENDPSTLTITSKFFLDSLGDDINNVPMSAAVCGQCHNDYYFDATNSGQTTNPYTGLDQMTPDAIFAYNNEHNLKDWVHPTTGANLLFVQHPEFETVYGGKQSHMAGLGYSCADCHMGTTTSDSGAEFTSHYWVSPLENTELLESKCKSCHKDLAAQVAEWQAKEDEQVRSVGTQIETMINLIGEKYGDEVAAINAAAEAGTTQEPSAELAELQRLHRSAQFYWNFVVTENSEGAHNPDFTKDTLDKAQKYIDEAMALLQ